MHVQRGREVTVASFLVELQVLADGPSTGYSHVEKSL